MGYQSLYRKYRSQTFSDLIGQGHVIRTLQNGISSQRVAHAYLFTGPRGTGKTSTARLLAKALCCENGPTPEPDNTCSICQEITVGACIDVIEMDAASDSGVDDIRDRIVNVVEYRPMVARYKVFIIDEVHDLSPKAFDALLKTIEEPPEHLIFILATTEFNKVPPTIRSRCQKFEFHRASMADLIGRLSYVVDQEQLQAEPAALTAIARMADGGFRDALTLLEQAILTAESGQITLAQVYDQLGLISEEVVDGLLIAIREGNVPEVMRLLEDVARLGRDPRAILESMLYRLRDLTLASYQIDAAIDDPTREATLHQTALRIGRDHLLRLRGEIAETHKVIRDISLPRLWLESQMVRMALGPAVAPPAAPAAPVEAPAVRRESAKPEPPVTVAAPLPTPVPSTTPAPVAVLPEWPKIVEELTSVSRTLGLRLNGARPTAIQDGKLSLEFDRGTDLEWFTSKPKALSALLEGVRKHVPSIREVLPSAGSGRKLVTEEPSTIELPLDGDRLEKLVRDVLGDV